MPTPDNYRLKIPNYTPATPEEHKTNLVAIERAMNALPFPIGQGHIALYDDGTGTGHFPSVTIPTSGSRTFELYTPAELPSGYAIPVPGTTHTLITIEMHLDPNDVGQEVGFVGHTDITLFGSSGQSEQYVTASGATKRLVTLQGFNTVQMKDLYWAPSIDINNGSGTPSVVVESISAETTFFPAGLYGTLNQTFQG